MTSQLNLATDRHAFDALGAGVRLLDGDDIDALATAELGLKAARSAAAMLARGGVSAGRVQVGEPDRWTRILVGLMPELDLLGYKQFHKIGRRVYYHILLFRLSTGEALAIVDGRRITGLRTASTAACAIGHVSGADPVTLAVIGSGEEAKEGTRAVHQAVTLAGVRVFSPTRANREAFAAEMQDELGVQVTPVASVDAAVATADHAYVATPATEAVLRLDQAKGLRCVASVGATRPRFRELDPAIIVGAELVVIDCYDTLEEAGDMVDAVAAGWDAASAILLDELLQSNPPPPGSATVVFKSIGSVEQDLVLAEALVRAAEAQGRGRVIDPIASLRTLP
jgi:ornithine cyclodeaminase/alanine dehydrogenase-like protein (mu-crystallin family)